MKITVLTNSPWNPTGYGTQGKYIGIALKELGHEVCYISNWGLGGSSVQWRGMTVYPMPMTKEQWHTFIARSRADVVLSLWDIWAMPFTDFRVPWIAYFPVDGSPISKVMEETIQKADWAVVYSRFAQEEMRKAGLVCHYVPHGIDTEVFCPGDRAEARREMYPIPDDTFLVTTVAANKGYPARKAWAELIQGFALFHATCPNSTLYLHTTNEPLGPGPNGGVTLMDLAEEIGINKALAIPSQGDLAIGITDEQLAKFYRASDVMLLPSMGEGFGLPVAEAQACGCPVITQACSSMTELTVNGVAIEPLQPWWVPGVNYFWQLPSIERIAAGLHKVHRWRNSKRERLSERGVRFFRENHSWPVVTGKWGEFLERVEGDIKSGRVRR